MARARALSRSPPPDRRPLRGADDRAEQHDPQAPEHDVTSWRTSAGTRNDLARAGKLLDAEPERVLRRRRRALRLRPPARAAHDFFVKYQDRILFGKDSYQPDEYPYYWRVFETNDEYFDYYRDYHAFWKLYGIGLPDQVLKKLYYQNALQARARVCRAPAFPANLQSTSTLWPLISSPAAQASSDRTSRRSSSGAAIASASPTA